MGLRGGPGGMQGPCQAGSCRAAATQRMHGAARRARMCSLLEGNFVLNDCREQEGCGTALSYDPCTTVQPLAQKGNNLPTHPSAPAPAASCAHASPGSASAAARAAPPAHWRRRQHHQPAGEGQPEAAREAAHTGRARGRHGKLLARAPQVQQGRQGSNKAGTFEDSSTSWGSTPARHSHEPSDMCGTAYQTQTRG